MTKPAKPAGDMPLLEWFTGGVGAVGFCAMLAVLIGSSVNGSDAPPDVRVSVERIAAVRDGYLVEFEVENTGDSTAADIQIAGELAGGERSVAHFDYLPPHSVRRGGMFFRDDPRASTLSLRAEGYSDP